LTLFNFMN